MFLHKSYTGKNLAPELWAKMFSANQVAGFLNQLFLSPEQINKIASFLHVDTNSQKLKVDRKFFGYALSKMGAANMILEL